MHSTKKLTINSAKIHHEIILIVTLALLVIIAVADFQIGSAALLISAIFLSVVSFVVVLTARWHQWDVFSPLIIGIGSYVISYPLGGIWAVIFGVYKDDQIFGPLLFSGLFLAGMVGGLVVVLGSPTNIAERQSELIKGRSYKLAVVLVVIGVSLNLAAIRFAGITTLGGLLHNLLNVRNALTHGGMYYVKFVIDNSLKLPLMLLLFRYLRSTDRAQRARVLPSLFLLLCLVLVQGFLSGSRSQILYPLLSMAVLVNMVGTPVSILPWLIGLFGVLPLATGYAQFRWLLLQVGDLSIHEAFYRVVSGLGFWQSIQSAFWRFSILDDFVNLWHLGIPFSFASSIPAFLVQPIPRILWPDKPLLYNDAITAIVTPHLAKLGVSESFGMVPELFTNFHIPGLFVGGLVFGAIIGLLQKLYLARRKDCVFAIIYTQLLLAPWGWFSGGLINSSMNILILMTLAFYVPLLRWVSRYKLDE